MRGVTRVGQAEAANTGVLLHFAVCESGGEEAGFSIKERMTIAWIPYFVKYH